MSGKAFYLGAAIAIVVAIFAGIWTVGGPIAARDDRFDQRRYEDLREIALALHCSNWRISQPVLPEKLDIESIRAYCGGVQITPDVLVDNETGVPYTYRKTGENDYAVCAVFHDADRTMRLNYQGLPIWNAAFDPDTGCVTGRTG